MIGVSNEARSLLVTGVYIKYMTEQSNALNDVDDV